MQSFRLAGLPEALRLYDLRNACASLRTPRGPTIVKLSESAGR
jgi:hypothetical protein